MMLKILITGINGLLGSKVHEVIKANSEFSIHGCGTKARSFENVVYWQGDLGNWEFVDSINSKFDFIIHCAAATDLKECDNNRKLAFNSNVSAVSNIRYKFPESRIIYISTDSVYAESNALISENSNVNPMNYYSKTKLLGEKELLKESDSNSLIFRLNLYGLRSPLGNSLVEWALKEIYQQNIIKGYINVYFNPLYTTQIANIILNSMLQNYPSGIYNLSSNTCVSKYDFLRSLCSKLSLNIDLVKPFSFKNNTAVKRPFVTCMNNNKIRELISDQKLLDYDTGLNLLKEDLYMFQNERL